VQRGEAPLRLFFFPPRLRVWGLKARFQAVLMGFASPYPPYPLWGNAL